MNPRNIRWAGNVERTGHKKCIESLFGKTGVGRDNWEELEVGGRVLIETECGAGSVIA